MSDQDNNEVDRTPDEAFYLPKYKNLNVSLEQPKNQELFLYLLQLMLIYLKLTLQIDWQWHMVVSPLIFLYGIDILFFIWKFIIAVIAYIVYRIQHKT